MGEDGGLSDTSRRLGGDSDVSGMGKLRWRAYAMVEMNSDAGTSETSGVWKAK